MAANGVRSRLVVGLVAMSAVLAVDLAMAQTRIRPGFNLFSVDQDMEIGKQSATEVERQLPLLRDRATAKYITSIATRLIAAAPGADYAYQFKVVNVSDINAFALPGGYLYLNRGLIEAADSEGMLAGVMAHEMAHVALRHGTNQASKAYLGQAGLGILGGLIAGDSKSTEKTVNAIGGFGMNALFLKFSRTDEEQADVVGAQMLASAGYDPTDMIDFFKMLEDKKDREPSKVEQFFSSHPTPGDRAERVKDERKLLKLHPTQPVGDFSKVRSRLQRMAPAQSMKQLARTESESHHGTSTSNSSRRVEPAKGPANIERPSSEYRAFEQRRRLFSLTHPANWSVHEPSNGDGVTIAPDGGFVNDGHGERNLTYGVIINHHDPFNDDSDDRFITPYPSAQGFMEGGGSDSGDGTQLAWATNDLLRGILRSNPNLKMVRDSQRNVRLNGADALSVVLSGHSEVTGQEERVTVFTRSLPDDHVIYALLIAPATDYDTLRPAFDRMVSSLRVSDEAVHH
jgi:Zn-dependent protease with chaperone function